MPLEEAKVKDTEQKHLLVVDDDEDNRVLLRDFFSDDGYTVTQAKNGAEAIATATKLKDELAAILMDVKMPDTDGIAVLKQLQEAKIDVPVILMTAYSTSSLAIRAMQLGAADYITKPLDLD